MEKELNERIKTIVTMRDGAEMDLDLDVTQRMIEDAEEWITNTDKVLTKVISANDLVKQENDILEEEKDQLTKLLDNYEN